MLLDSFSSPAVIATASVEQIKAVEGIGPNTAKGYTAFPTVQTYRNECG
jgi:ERCC4-type nuclease